MSHRVIFVTGNREKFLRAQDVCQPHGIELVQQPADIDEIQSEDPTEIIRVKTEQIFQKFQKPVIVSDDSWSIPALKGFPGPYMKSVNQWFAAPEWLNIMGPHSDRSIILVQLLAYQDEHEYKLFQSELSGQFLHEARGAYGSPFQKVVTLTGDHGLSIAEVYDRSIAQVDRDTNESWKAFINWQTREITAAT